MFYFDAEQKFNNNFHTSMDMKRFATLDVNLRTYKGGGGGVLDFFLDDPINTLSFL